MTQGRTKRQTMPVTERGERAAVIIGDPLFEEVAAEVMAQCLQAIADTPVHDRERREREYMRYHLVRDAVATLHRFYEDGQAARHGRQSPYKVA